MSSARIDPRVRAERAPEMFHVIARAAQHIALWSDADHATKGKILGDMCGILDSVGGEGFADACAEDSSMAAPEGWVPV